MRARFILAVLSLVLAPRQSVGQGSVERAVPDRIACRGCAIDRATIAVLRSASVEGEINERPLAVRASAAGEFWVLSQRMGPRIYSSAGAFLRTIGRSGSGPGEFQAPDDVIWLPGDSALVMDGVTRRATVLTRDGRPARSIQIPATLHNTAVLSWPSRVLSTGRISAPSTVGLPLHLIDFSGEMASIARSFSPNRGTLRPSDLSSTYHFIARSASGRLFTATPKLHRVYEWTEAGHLRSVLARATPWFPPAPAERELGGPDAPPSAAISALDVDAEGLIWLYVRIPSPHWRDAWANANFGAREIPLRAIEWGRLFSTRVEVIDPMRGEVLAKTDIPGHVISALGDGRVALMVTSKLGGDEVRIDRVSLRRSSRP